MTASMILDIALVAVVVITVMYFAHKGFLAAVISLGGNLISLFGAYYISGKLSPTVFENFFQEGMLAKTTQILSTDGKAGLENLIAQVSNFLPQQIVEKFAQSAQGIIDTGAPDIAAQLVETVIKPLVVPIISIVIFAAVFIICRFIVAIISTALVNVNKIPVVGGLNRSLGAVAGFFAGLVDVILILCVIWAVIAITDGELSWLNNTILADSYGYSAFFKFNPFF